MIPIVGIVISGHSPSLKPGDIIRLPEKIDGYHIFIKIKLIGDTMIYGRKTMGIFGNGVPMIINKDLNVVLIIRYRKNGISN